MTSKHPLLKKIALTCTVLVMAILANAQDFKSYNNYDFVSGEKTLFEDNFLYQKNEKPFAKWQILGGKISMGEMDNEKYLSVDEYYTKIKPILFGVKQLPDSFSIEYDTWLDNGYDGNPGIEINLVNGDNTATITPNKHSMSVTYPGSNSVSKDNPEPYFGENKFYDRWVHISIAVYKKSLKVYLDQYKMIELADCGVKAQYIMVSGNTSGNMKILLKNLRVSTGFPQKIKLDNGKFITRAIKFDVNKSVIKPESLPVLKMIQQFLNENPTANFEIGGHTDSDGDDAYNLKLSQQRADAVKERLIKMGISASRLTSTGYGETKPVAPNTTPEGKASNRRVEFVKK